MSSRRILQTVAVAALLYTGAAALPASLGIVSPAVAGVNVSVNINTFYDGLQGYGDWVSYRDAYVWVPGRVGPGWRPYTLGHWAWTDEYGWMWISDEPFGWAAYHYGRWGYSNEVGWYWVPGRRWAPAWVSWRNSDAAIAWAPLPPERDDTVVNININTLPDYYWNVVPARQFLSPRISASLVLDIGERQRVFQNSRRGGNVIVRNNIVVNNFIDVNFVRRQTGQQIRPVRIVKADRPGRLQVNGDQVTAFVGNVDAGNGQKPPKVADVNQVKNNVKDRVKRDKGQTEVGLPGNGQGNDRGNGQAGQDAGNSGQNQTGAADNTLKGRKLGKPKIGNGQNDQTQGADQNGQPQMGGADQGAQNGQADSKAQKLKRKPPKDMTQQNGAGQPDQMQSGAGGQPPVNNKNRKKLMQMQQNGADQSGQTMDPGNGQPGGGQMQNPRQKKRQQDMMQQNGGMDQGGQPMGGNGQNQRKSKRLQQQQMNGQQMNGQPNGQQMNGQPNGQKKKPKCDPQTDPSCLPGQN